MKREIKFRAWDGEKMVEVAELHLNAKELPVDDEEWLSMYYSPLMQYTCLHDKNGREIYESDILKVTGEDGGSYVATVKWFGDEGYPAFDLEGIPAEWNYDANALSTIFNSGVETCEIIGNVHYSHELSDGE